MKLRYWTTKEIAYLEDNYRDMNNAELSNGINRTEISIATKLTKLGLRRKTEDKEFAVYKGDNLIMIGTRSELKDRLKIAETTFRNYRNPSYCKRIGRNATRIIGF